MAVIDLSTMDVEELAPVLTSFKYSNQCILPFSVSGSSEAVFSSLLEKSASAGKVEVSGILQAWALFE